MISSFGLESSWLLFRRPPLLRIRAAFGYIFLPREVLVVHWSASSFHRVLAASQRLREVVFVLNVKLARLAGSVAQLI